MEEDRKMTLQEAVNIVSWTHNTNVNTFGFSPMQLVTGKNIFFPGITTGTEATITLYDDQMVRRIMECHYGLVKEFRKL